MCRILLFLLLLSNVNCQESSQYLQTAVRDLRRMNYRQTLRRADTLMTKTAPQEASDQTADRRIQHQSQDVIAPPLSLTKGELAALYESALAKGETLKLDTGEHGYLHTAVHELDHVDLPKSNHLPKGEESKDEDGYYYYYYPVKSFMDEMTSGSSTKNEAKPWKYPTTTPHPPYQYHSHHHEVTIKKENGDKEKKEKKGIVKPLFMAISGFVGMAVMFVISMLILPRFENKKPKKSLLWQKSEDMDELARLALNAIEGKYCRERFACELNKTARNFNLQDNRFIKLLKRIAPGTFGGQIDRISKYGDKYLQCTLIPCTKRIIKIQKPNIKKSPVKKKNVAQKKN